jgi:dTDP-4-dehydro-6-deoxy-alpha-D-glucopyranose 2,3-dehydratase
MRTKRKNEFVISLITEKNPFITTSQVTSWLNERNRNVKVDVKRIMFSQLKNWSLSKQKGILAHDTGKFFTIEGINVQTNWGKVTEWEQPIISQPEVGYLGIITKEFDGILYFLLQAKIEPGNVNFVQLSPTLQATKSNYLQVHKGKKPLYLEYFQNAKNDQVLLDQLQSEQGARFLKKRNRNIIIKVKEDITVYDDFIWLTLGQIKKLIKFNNLVNMDTRTVISGIPFDNSLNISLPSEIRDNLLINSFETGMFISAIEKEAGLHTFDQILNWLTALKCKYDLNVRPVSLFDIKDWHITDKDIHHKDNSYFKVIAAEVEIGNREVQRWTQPLVEPVREGLIAFIVKKINSVYHFLVQAKLECGNFDILEMAPTVQCLTGRYADSKDLPYLDTVLNAGIEQIRHSSLQSEEGGRFFKEQNRNMIIEVDSDFPLEVPENYTWATLNQLNTFLKFNNYLNIQARSLIAAINFI